MTAKIERLWAPGTPYPRRANRRDMAAIAQHHFGVPFTPRSFERMPLKRRKVKGTVTFEVESTLAEIEAQSPEFIG